MNKFFKELQISMNKHNIEIYLVDDQIQFYEVLTMEEVDIGAYLDAQKLNDIIKTGENHAKV